MVDFAIRRYPLLGEGRFLQGSVDQIPWPDNFFDVVFSSGALSYELHYKKAMQEHFRVSSRYAILTRIPVYNLETTYTVQEAYGTQFVNIIFNETELKRIIADTGFKLLQEKDLDCARRSLRTPTPEHGGQSAVAERRESGSIRRFAGLSQAS